MTAKVPKTFKEIKDNLTAKHIAVSVMWPLFQISKYKCQHGDRRKVQFCLLPVVLGILYASPQILDNVTYVLPYMEKMVQLVTSSFTIIHQFMLSITIHFAQKLKYDYFSFYYISIRTSRQFEHFHIPWYITIYMDSEISLILKPHGSSKLLQCYTCILPSQ
jgi:hypothetical protein